VTILTICIIAICAVLIYWLGIQEGKSQQTAREEAFRIHAQLLRNLANLMTDLWSNTAVDDGVVERVAASDKDCHKEVRLTVDERAAMSEHFDMMVRLWNTVRASTVWSSIKYLDEGK
jgi:hypothetical protein